MTTLPPIGSYFDVRITQTLPNCLVGEALPPNPDTPFIAPAIRQPQFVVLN